MSDVFTAPKPLLNPVLTLTKKRIQKEAPTGGKKEKHVVAERLGQQRQVLSQQVATLRSSEGDAFTFAGYRLFVAEMFSDSLAISKSPKDLFRGRDGSLITGAGVDSYLVEASVGDLRLLEDRIINGVGVAVRCDISRTQGFRAYGSYDIFRGRTAQSLWAGASELVRGRAFQIWLPPFRNQIARDQVFSRLEGLRANSNLIGVSARISLGPDGITPDRTLRGSSLAVLQREYREHGHAKSIVEIPSVEALERLISSGGVYRIEPVPTVTVTAPGVGEEPHEVPSAALGSPIVGIVDGGCSARRYAPMEAWREQPYLRDSVADIKHGNQIASVVVHGHEWNNNLPLPELYCRIGIAQAIPRKGAMVTYNPSQLASYIERVVSRHPDTRVWNLSWNETVSCEKNLVSALGHDLSNIARKHNVLFVIAAGNVSGTNGDCVAPPADCEAALVVGGRQMNMFGGPGGSCPESLPGHGPELQLVPHVTSFSPMRLLGGGVRLGTSFPTGSISALAAHTFENLRDPTPDLVRALIINQTDLAAYDTKLGWGTPSHEVMPWNCAPGTVTLAVTAALKPGWLYHWEDIPIPPELIKNGKLSGQVSLTTVHKPLCNAEGGPSYIATRVAAAVQYQNGKGRTQKLIGSKENEDTLEAVARLEEFKWQPLRRESRNFAKRGGLEFTGSHFRLYARVFGRNINQFGYRVNNDIPEIETVFVITFSDGTKQPALFNSMASSLGNFVESAVVDTELHVDNES
jgi:Subtilase family